jgi:hypothetical protein
MIKEWFKKQEEIEGSVWLTHWRDPGFTESPPDHDYRDSLPLRPEQIAELYAPVIRDGSWTFGLVQCWGKRSKLARVRCWSPAGPAAKNARCAGSNTFECSMQSAVHIPCCPSFNINPLAWRGLCFGRYGRSTAVHACINA